MGLVTGENPNLGSYGIHWFRRDLRVAGNPALQWSWKEHQGRVVGFFCFDTKFLSRSDFSPDRFAFYLSTLKDLQAELRSIGSDLIVLDVGPRDAFSLLFESLKSHALPLPKTLSYNRDYEPFARERDQAMDAWMPAQWDVAVHSDRDHVLIEPTEILKKESGSSYYQIYTPYAKRWFDQLRTSEVLERIAIQKKGLNYLEKRARGQVPSDLFKLSWSDVFNKKMTLEDHLERYIQKNRSQVNVSLPDAGGVAALKRTHDFKKYLSHYNEKRDFPSEANGTSHLSIYFKNGSFTPAQVIAELGLSSCSLKEKSGATQFLKELVWREFYYSILYHCPRVENEAFIKKYKNLAWENREDFFQAWTEGRTGYPIVDAGMRQLNQTGWMHNRVRMIVASFLTKDLLIDWKWGERYFMKRLLDGDLAPNNGGWQWAASTGCDPQPYFRIFNPTLQSQKFDPEGEYIRRFVPELKNLSNKKIHEPQNPIVDHAGRKLKALMLYRK